MLLNQNNTVRGDDNSPNMNKNEPELSAKELWTIYQIICSI